MNLIAELESIRTELNATQAVMMSNYGPGSALGDMIFEELSAIWRSIDALAAAIESTEGEDRKSIGLSESSKP